MDWTLKINKKMYYAQFWRLEVWNQGASMARSWWRSSFWLQTPDSSRYPAGWEDEERAIWGPFNKDTNPIHLIHPIHEGSTLIT